MSTEGKRWLWERVAAVLAAVTVAVWAQPSFASGIAMATGALFIDVSLSAALVLLMAAVHFAGPRLEKGGRTANSVGWVSACWCCRVGGGGE